jgi:protein-S-isoprenylcysteine O-methyltransferase Ste14
MMGWIAFILLSIPMLILSRRDLVTPRRHGFYRFFGYEAIIGLLLLNLSGWFDDPLSARQIVSWALLAGSFGLAAHGFYLLKVVGRPNGSIENTTRLVRVGAYRFIRHPLYGSLILFAWGAMLKHTTPVNILLALAATGLLTATARTEERENLARFGEEYTAYLARTKMFIPHVF